LIGVNIAGHGPQKLKQIMDKEKLPWRSFADAGAINAKWNAATPTFYVLDAKGVIRHKWIGSPGAKAMDSALEKLLDELGGNAK
jgi:peroxiredoxin